MLIDHNYAFDPRRRRRRNADENLLVVVLARNERAAGLLGFARCKMVPCGDWRSNDRSLRDHQ